MEIFPTAQGVHVSPPYLTVVCMLKIRLPNSTTRISCFFTNNEKQCRICRASFVTDHPFYPTALQLPFGDRVEILRELMSVGATEIGWLGTCWASRTPTKRQNSNSREL